MTYISVEPFFCHIKKNLMYLSVGLIAGGIIGYSMGKNLQKKSDALAYQKNMQEIYREIKPYLENEKKQFVLERMVEEWDH